MKINIKSFLASSSSVLALGYMSGQGLTFVSQLLIRNFGSAELLGLVVILVSLFSFAFQFNDFGNTTSLVRKISLGELNDVRGFLVVRGVFAALIAFLVVYQALNVKDVKASATFLYLIPLVALFAGFMPTASLEVKNDYKSLAISQNLPWALNACFLLLLIFFELDLYLMSIFWLLGTLSSTIIANGRGINFLSNFLLPINVGKSVGLVVTHIGSPLVGQLYGRYVILTITAAYGLAEIGSYGIAKYFQVGAALLVSFLLRPIHRSLNVSLESRSSFDSSTLFVLYRRPILVSVSVFIFVAMLLILQGMHVIPGAIGWLCLSLVLPFWTIGSIASQLNARSLTSKTYLLTEMIGLFFNFLIFGSLLKVNPVLAIVAGEIGQYLCIVLFGVCMRKANK